MKDLTLQFKSEFGFVLTYGGFGGGRNNLAGKALVRTPEEVYEAMSHWHTYNNKNSETLIPSEQFKQTVNAIFSIEDGSWKDKVYIDSWTKEEVRERVSTKSGYPIRTYDLKTKNAGAWSLNFYKALASTLEEHDEAYRAECEARKQERIRIAKEERDRRMADMSIVRRGWYSVMMTFHCYYWSERRCEMQWGQKNFSGKVIANSQLDAYNKACHDIEVNSDPTECQGPQFPDPTNQSMFDAYFLGMKTDEGYSLAAWEEFSKTDEYKESVK